ncbi:MAG: undecaprenyl-diphosphate phosphatase [Balneolaceae bacterium]
MDYFESFLIALLQGVTEFLPISSSGHIVIMQGLLGQDLDQGMVFNIITHFGTLGSIVIYFRKELGEMAVSAWQVFSRPTTIVSRWQEDEAMRFNMYVLLSMIPAGVVGFTLRHQLNDLFANPVGVASMFIVTGSFLYVTRFFHEKNRALTTGNTFIIGIAQAFALIPGISRSGATISMAIYLGINRDDIAKFTFIMMLPVVAGATLVELLEIGAGGVEASYYPHLLLGFFVALLSGYYSLKYLIRIFKSGHIHHFSWYCWAVGGLTLWYFI